MSDAYIFVLWAERFEEVPAAIFVTTLRQRGLRVKVVSLTARPSSGANGLTLLPDLTLSQALPVAAQTICLIVPCSPRDLEHLTYDPRLKQFFNRAHDNGATFIIKQTTDGAALSDLLPACRWVAYSEAEDLVSFAQQLIPLLEDKNQ